MTPHEATAREITDVIFKESDRGEGLSYTQTMKHIAAALATARREEREACIRIITTYFVDDDWRADEAVRSIHQRSTSEPG